MFIKEEKIKEISKLVEEAKSKPTPEATTDLAAILQNFRNLKLFEEQPLVTKEFTEIDNDVIEEIKKQLMSDGGNEIPRLEEFLKEQKQEAEKEQWFEDVIINDFEEVKLGISAFPDLINTIQDKSGDTALHIAIRENNSDMIKILMAN
jgi:hypothetical protein